TSAVAAAVITSRASVKSTIDMTCLHRLSTNPTRGSPPKVPQRVRSSRFGVGSILSILFGRDEQDRAGKLDDSRHSRPLDTVDLCLSSLTGLGESLSSKCDRVHVQARGKRRNSARRDPFHP